MHVQLVKTKISACQRKLDELKFAGMACGRYGGATVVAGRYAAAVQQYTECICAEQYKSMLWCVCCSIGTCTPCNCWLKWRKVVAINQNHWCTVSDAAAVLLLLCC